MKTLPILIILTILFIHAVSAESLINESLNSSDDFLNLTIQNNSENSSQNILSSSANASASSSSSENSSETENENPGVISEGLYYCPQGDGYVGEIADEHIHDSGRNGAGDSLEVYCRNNTIRLCLSEEPCPWRNDILSNDDITCSGNYGNSPMAFSADETGINIAALVGTGNQKIENIYCNGISWSVEFSEINENSPENNYEPPTENNNQNVCNGCEFQGNCVPFGYRLENQNQSVYCDLSKTLKPQKEQDVSCQNDFECLSGQCSEGKCINLQKTLEETNSTLQKIINFLKEFFGFE